MDECGWHTSPQKDTQATADDMTGEIRVPLSLYLVDQLQSDGPLVLSRREAETLYTALGRLLAPTPVSTE